MTSPEQLSYDEMNTDSKVADTLVNIALGIDKADYITAAKAAVVLGHIRALALAEARLHDYDTNDQRDPLMDENPEVIYADDKRYADRIEDVTDYINGPDISREEQNIYSKTWTDEIVRLDDERAAEDTRHS